MRSNPEEALRDKFATAALSGVVKYVGAYSSDIGKQCYKIADQMIKARTSTPKETEKKRSAINKEATELLIQKVHAQRSRPRQSVEFLQQ